MIALVRMLPMPPGHTVHNYPSGCLEFKRNQLLDRWPSPLALSTLPYVSICRDPACDWLLDAAAHAIGPLEQMFGAE